jgi:hypothetical protein
MAEVEIVYVAVIPQDNPDIDLVKAVAGIIGKDAYQTRLLLAGSIPRIVLPAAMGCGKLRRWRAS